MENYSWKVTNQGRPIVPLEYFPRNCWLDLGLSSWIPAWISRNLQGRSLPTFIRVLSLFSSSVLPFVSIVHLWSGSPRGRRRAMRRSFSLSFLCNLLSFLLSSVRFRRVASKHRRRLFFSFSFLLLFLFPPCPFALRAPSFRSPIVIYKCACEGRKIRWEEEW